MSGHPEELPPADRERGAASEADDIYDRYLDAALRGEARQLDED